MLTDGAAASIGAGATVNLLTGHPIEFVGVACVARLLITADAAGVTQQFLINVGGDQKVPIGAGATVNVAAAAGEGPKDDEDVVATNVPLPQGTRSQWNVTNTTGGAIIVRWRAYLLP